MLASVLALCLAAPPAQPPAPGPYAKSLLTEAIGRFNNFDDEGAAPLLKRVLAINPSPEISAKAHLYLGLIDLNAVRLDAARRELRAALEANWLIELPAQSSPKVVHVFADVRQALEEEKRKAQEREEREARAPAARPNPEVQQVPLVTVQPAELPGAEPPARSHALALTLGGIGLACGAVAIVGAVEVASFNSYVGTVNSTTTTGSAAAASAQSTAQAWQIVGIVFAAVGVGALGAGVFTW